MIFFSFLCYDNGRTSYLNCSSTDTEKGIKSMPALKKKKILRRLLITAILLLAVFVSLPYIVSAIAKQFTSQEQKIRTDWTENVSQLLGTD